MASVTKLSPGVQVREIDLTNFIPNVGVSYGAFVGDFQWGPAFDVVLIDNINDLITVFGKPTERNFESWFSAYNFLCYTNNLNVVRAVDGADALNAVATGAGVYIPNEEIFSLVLPAETHANKLFAAKYPGALGNSLKLSMADKYTFDNWEYKEQFIVGPGTSAYVENMTGDATIYDELHAVVIDEGGVFTGVAGSILERFEFMSKARDAKSLDGEVIYYGSIINDRSNYIRYLGPIDTSSGLRSVTVTNGGSGYTTVPTVSFSGGGGTGATAVAFVTGGVVTKVEITNPGSGYTSAPTVAFTGGGGADAAATATITNGEWGVNAVNNLAQPILFNPIGSAAYEVSFSNGADGSLITTDEYKKGYDLFADVDEVEANLIFTGQPDKAVIQHCIQNIAEKRMDAVVFFSPSFNSTQGLSSGEIAEKIVAFRNSMNVSSSYAVMDSGWKLQYDQFNDKYRWIPLNGDIAGLCAKTDWDYDPWYSPAGFNRGKIKNCVSLVYNPNKSSRDMLYSNQVNCVSTFKGDGTILFGDKTLLAKPSAFGYINVRRLFIVLEKAISKAAKYQLFEFNDQFTRANFVNMVEPYLREVKGRRGIYDFKVVCDETNNTPEVIDRAEFVASIFIKPARSINFITLNFVAVRTGVRFEEVLNAF